MNVPDASIKISLPGKSAHSQNFVDDFVFVGGLPTLQIKKRIKLSVTTDSGDFGQGAAQAEHGFGYKPQAMAFVTTRGSTTYGSTYINAPGNWDDGDEILGEQSSQVFDCYVDEQNVYISALSLTFVPMVSTTFRDDTYEFDILLFMEEAKTV